MDKKEKSYSSHGAGVLCIKNKKVLLVQLNYGKFKGQWILPGGMLEKGEHPHVAAVREFKEETNLEIKIHDLLTVRYRVFDERPDNTYWVFTGKLHDFDSENQIEWNEDELQAAKFWDIKAALTEESVRPHTKYYINLYLKNIDPDGISKMQGPYADYCYISYLSS